jgi:hypothetical protein
LVEEVAGVVGGGAGGAVHGLDHGIEAGVGAIGAEVVVAVGGEASGGQAEDDFAEVDAGGIEEAEAIEVVDFAPAVNAVGYEDAAEFEQALVVDLVFGGRKDIFAAGMVVVADELDGLIEGEALVAGDAVVEGMGEELVSELALETAEDGGIGRDIEVDDAGAGLQLGAEQHGAEEQADFPVGSEVGAVAKGTAIAKSLGFPGDGLVFHPSRVAQAVAQDAAGVAFAGAVVEGRHGEKMLRC